MLYWFGYVFDIRGLVYDYLIMKKIGLILLMVILYFSFLLLLRIVWFWGTSCSNEELCLVGYITI
jgi:hypothetical protein